LLYEGSSRRRKNLYSENNIFPAIQNSQADGIVAGLIHRHFPQTELEQLFARVSKTFSAAVSPANGLNRNVTNRQIRLHNHTTRAS
jgi:hypothetical protein